jgi:ATP-dependent protease ClpP protease subunit
MNILIQKENNIVSEPLIQKPELIYIKDFSEDSYKKLKDDFNKALNADLSIIPVIVDSYGGSVDALIGMINIFRNCPVPVATILETKAMSCGVILFSCGTKGYRYMSDLANLMIHEVSNFSRGKIEEMKSSVEYGIKLNDQIFKILDKNAGKSPGFFQKEIQRRKNADWFFGAVEAKKLGIVDHIKIPNFTVKIKKEYILE